MKHVAKEVWQDYIEYRLDSAEREACENHLYDCNDCLQLYIGCMEHHIQNQSSISNGAPTTERVMEAINLEETSLKKPTRFRKLFHLPLIQYTAAAFITIVLMSSGAFQEIADRLSNFEEEAEIAYQREGSVSERLMEKTVSLLDAFHRKEQGRESDE